jgi:hypothetical protein
MRIQRATQVQRRVRGKIDDSQAWPPSVADFPMFLWSESTHLLTIHRPKVWLLKPVLKPQGIVKKVLKIDYFEIFRKNPSMPLLPSYWKFLIRIEKSYLISLKLDQSWSSRRAEHRGILRIWWKLEFLNLWWLCLCLRGIMRENNRGSYSTAGLGGFCTTS